MPRAFTMTRRVAFSETDAAGIVHFAQFFRYMEDAEHALLRDAGLSVHAQREGVVAGFPRVAASCEYRRPLRFEDEFVVAVDVASRTDKAVTYRFTFTRVDDGPASGDANREPHETEPVAEGELRVVYAVKQGPHDRFRARRLPPEFDAAIGPPT